MGAGVISFCLRTINSFCLRKLAIFDDVGLLYAHFLNRLVLLVGLDQAELLDDLHATLYPAEDGVLAV
jgi:hypothetical protein